MKLALFLPIAAVAVALAGCNRDRGAAGGAGRSDPNVQDRSGTTTVTGAPWVANEAAIDRIVASRCAREVTCSNVGPDKHFTSNDLCVREVRSKLHDELKASACPAGIDGKELDECLDAIRNESCTNPIEAMARLAACRTGELCLKTEMPHR